MKISEINFEDGSQVRKVIVKMYEHFTDRVPNIAMQDRLLKAVLNDPQFTPEECFKIVADSIETFALYQDNPAKRGFVYLNGIIQGKKLEHKKNIEKIRKQNEAVEAHNARIASGKEDQLKKNKEIIELAGLLKNNKRKFTGDEYLLIESMITNGNFLSARINIEKKLGASS